MSSPAGGRPSGRERPLLGALAALLLAATASVAVAQEGPSLGDGRLWVLHYDRVDAGQRKAHEANVREWAAAFRAARMGHEWAWEAFEAGDSTFVYRSRLKLFADLDAEDDRQLEMLSALGEERLGELREGLAAVRSQHTEVVVERPELGYRPPAPAARPAALRVTTHHVRPAAIERFEDVVAQIAEAVEQSPDPPPLEVHEVRLGDGAYRLVFGGRTTAQLRSQAKIGDLLRAAFGASRAAELLAAWRECVTRYETADWRLRPDLSYLPEEPPLAP